MKVEMKNYRGVAEARLTMAPIALVAGPNGAGKSSIAQGIAAALTKNAAPIDGIAKNAAGQLLRDGAKRGNCTVGDDSGSVTANWPGASTSEDGTAPWASEIACGLTSLVDMKPKDAAALLISAIEALPTLEHLQTALPNVDAEMLKQVWGAIQADGWDSAHKRAQERGAKLKGAWEHVTGEKYGSAKAEGWRPVGAPEAGTEQLQAELKELREELEQAIANQAVGQAEVQRLEAQVQAGAEAATQAEKLEGDIGRGNAHAAKLQAELDALPKPETVETLAECPHCNGHLVVVSSTLVRAPAEGGISAEENEQRQAAIDAKRAELQRTNAALQQLGGQRASALQSVSLAAAAREQLEAMPEGGATAEQIAGLKNDIAEAEADLRAVTAVQSAEKLHGDISENQLVISALAPDGVRQTVLAEKIGVFNATLARLSGTAGWPVVALSDDLSVTLGGRAYILLSESEKYRARVVLQVALADLDGSDVVLVDAADILDRGGRNGLFKLLASSGMRALVCMTMNQAADVPDLAAAGLGQSYWLADNILAPVGAQ